MCLCNKCKHVAGGLVVLLAVAFVLKDLQVWNFWGINWWSAGLVWLSLVMVVSHVCPECRELRKECMPAKKKKK